VSMELKFTRNNYDEKFRSTAVEAKQRLQRFYSVPAFDLARIDMRLAYYSFVQGNWDDVINTMKSVLPVFKAASDHKRWREAKFMESLCDFHTSTYHRAYMGFHQVVLSAQKDGDMYYETSALYWRSQALLVSQGPSQEIFASLRAALDIAKDCKVSKVPAAVLLTLNEFLRMVTGSSDMTTSEYINLLQHNLNDENAQTLINGREETQNAIAYQQFVEILLYTCEARLLEDVEEQDQMMLEGMGSVRGSTDEEKKDMSSGLRNTTLKYHVNPQEILAEDVHKAFTTRAMLICKALQTFAKTFPYARAYAAFATARISAVQGRSKVVQLWKEARRLAVELKNDFVVGWAEFELGHRGQDKKTRNQHFSRAIKVFNHSNIDYLYHPVLSYLLELNTQGAHGSSNSILHSLAQQRRKNASSARPEEARVLAKQPSRRKSYKNHRKWNMNTMSGSTKTIPHISPNATPRSSHVRLMGDRPVGLDDGIDIP